MSSERIDHGGDYYRVLGVPEDAGEQEIRRAYRRLARRHHPDLNAHSDAARCFNAVSEAYQALHDPAIRARYDQSHHPPTSPGDDQRAGAARTRSRPRHPADGDARAGGRFPASPDAFGERASPLDVEAILELSPEEAALAASVPVTLTDAHGQAIVLPAGTRAGHRLRIRGAGRRAQLGVSSGDLLLTVVVSGRRHRDPYLT